MSNAGAVEPWWSAGWLPVFSKRPKDSVGFRESQRCLGLSPRYALAISNLASEMSTRTSHRMPSPPPLISTASGTTPEFRRKRLSLEIDAQLGGPVRSDDRLRPTFAEARVTKYHFVLSYGNRKVCQRSSSYRAPVYRDFRPWRRVNADLPICRRYNKRAYLACRD